MTYSDGLDAISTVRSLCQDNLDAFAFITLYLTHCINEKLEKN